MSAEMLAIDSPRSIGGLRAGFRIGNRYDYL